MFGEDVGVLVELGSVVVVEVGLVVEVVDVELVLDVDVVDVDDVLVVDEVELVVVVGGGTFTTAVAELLPRSGSIESDVTSAVLLTSPGPVVCTTMLHVADAPDASDPMVQVHGVPLTPPQSSLT